ncbi:N-formylglutamate deformylase [Bifidobacterium longum subsp. longum]|nr:N-formylglutamate deformylase [Bifidobacterium longum subsp. longum]
MLVHTPHAGRLVPDGFDRTRLTDAEAFDQTCEQVRDRHADTLGLMIAARLHATIMLDHTTRMWCDPERYPDDREEMNTAGMGAIPTRDIDGHPLYKPGQAPGMRERGQRFRLLYTPWHRMLQAQCRTMLDTYGRCTIIDVHTHPRRTTPVRTARRPAAHPDHHRPQQRSRIPGDRGTRRRAPHGPRPHRRRQHRTPGRHHPRRHTRHTARQHHGRNQMGHGRRPHGAP